MPGAAIWIIPLKQHGAGLNRLSLIVVNGFGGDRCESVTSLVSGATSKSMTAPVICSGRDWSRIAWQVKGFILQAERRARVREAGEFGAGSTGRCT